MRKLAIALAVLAGGCATPTQIYSSEVDKREVSSKSISEVSQCLQLRWAEAPITGPDGKLSFPMKNGYGQVLGMLTLTEQGSGTLIELRKTGQMLFGGRDWSKCV